MCGSVAVVEQGQG